MSPPKLVSALATHSSIAVYRGCMTHTHVHTESVVHDHAALGLCLEGEGEFWLGATYRFSPGSITLVPEGASHYMFRAEGVHMVGLSLCTACMSGAWGERLRHMYEQVHHGAAACHQASPAQADQINHTINRLEVCLTQDVPSLLLRDGLMSTLVADIWSTVGNALAPHGHTNPSLVAQALSYIQDHAIQTISLADVARAVSRHPSHVAACVKAETGRTVVEWITHGRMAQTRQLLMSSDENIDLIADRMGFASLSHFHRTFKRWHGMSPNAWRHAHHTP